VWGFETPTLLFPWAIFESHNRWVSEGQLARVDFFRTIRMKESTFARAHAVYRLSGWHTQHGASQ
jgi:hypothetical protein